MYNEDTSINFLLNIYSLLAELAYAGASKASISGFNSQIGYGVFINTKNALLC